MLTQSDRPTRVRELIRQLRGPAVVARAVGISTNAVCNWAARGDIPRRHHLAVWQLAAAAGLDWRPPGTAGLTLAQRPVSQAA